MAPSCGNLWNPIPISHFCSLIQMFHILTFCVYIIELLSVPVLAEVQAYFLFYMFLDKTTYIDVRRAVGGRVDVEAVAVVTTQLFVDHDHSMVFHRLVGLDDGTHR